MRKLLFLANIFSAIWLCLVLLSACGQKGPLFLPDQNPASAPVQDTESDDDEIMQPSEEDTDTNDKPT